MRPYYEHAGITIYHGDCRDVLGDRRYEQWTADVLLTDPPYGFNKAAWDTAFPHWVWSLVPYGIRTAGFMIGVGNLPHLQPNFNTLVYRWTLVAHMVNGMTRGGIGFGNWIPCAVYSRVGVSLYEADSDVRPFAVEGVKNAHPSPKPLNVMRWFLRRVIDDQSRIVLDPFCGSGTTLRAAKDCGLQAIGIDVNERYCEMAAQRLSQEVLPDLAYQTLAAERTAQRGLPFLALEAIG